MAYFWPPKKKVHHHWKCEVDKARCVVCTAPNKEDDDICGARGNEEACNKEKQLD